MQSNLFYIHIFLYPFLEPDQTTYHLNISVIIGKVTELGMFTLMLMEIQIIDLEMPIKLLMN